MLKGISFGEFDVKITIQSVTTANHAITNEPETTYSTLATVWSKRLGPKSNEVIEADQTVAVGPARFMIRRRTDVTERMRIVDGSNTYRISGIEDFGRQGYLILTAEKRDNG